MTILYNGNPDGLLTYTSPSPKLCMGPTGTYRYGPHNLYVNSASPANQSITVVSGAAYTIVITGSVSVTASGAATGTWTAGTTNFTAATGTLTLGSTSGAGTVHVRRANSDTTYLATGANARYGLPYEWNSSGVLQGILVEEARTNLALRSSAFDNAAWSRQRINAFGAGSVADAAVAPNGLTEAEYIQEDTATGTRFVYQTCTITAGVTITVSAYFKAWQRTRCIVGAASDGGVNGFRVVFDLSGVAVGTTTTLGTGSYLSSSIASVGNGWYRCIATGTVAAASTTPAVSLGIADNSGNASYAGDGASGLYVWGAQLETGTFATSPIETFGATVTRAVDTVTLATSAFPALGSAFGVVIEAELLGIASGYPHSVRIDDVALNNIANANLNPSLNAKLYAKAGGVVSADLSSGVTITRGVPFKQAMSFEANRFAVSVNGAAVTTDVSGAVPTGMTTLALGGISALRIRKLLVVPHSYTNGQLQSLSA